MQPQAAVCASKVLFTFLIGNRVAGRGGVVDGLTCAFLSIDFIAFLDFVTTGSRHKL